MRILLFFFVLLFQIFSTLLLAQNDFQQTFNEIKGNF
jgi:hypothetical protein